MNVNERLSQRREKYPNPFDYLNAMHDGLGDRVQKSLTLDQAAHFTAGMLAMEQIMADKGDANLVREWLDETEMTDKALQDWISSGG